MNEGPFREIEKVLLYVSEARKRAATVADAIARDGAEPHLVEALNAAEQEPADLHRRLIHPPSSRTCEASRRLLELTREIAEGRRPYDPFGDATPKERRAAS